MEAKAVALKSAVRTLPAAMQTYLRQLAAALPAAFREHAALLVLVLAYWASALVVGEITGRPRTATITMYLAPYRLMVPVVILVLLIGRALTILILERPARPLTQFLAELRYSLASPDRIANAIPVLMCLLVFGGTFTVLKTSFPLLFPFGWDVPLEHVDRWLHGGIAPWQLLQPIVGMPVITAALNRAYNYWFLVLSFILIWQTFSQRDPQLRLQFFFTLVLGWILLGTIAAALLFSAGPCFFGRATGLPDPFTPLMDYLRQANQVYPVWAITTQDGLWQRYLANDASLGAGISAMPSMHVALATLFALVCWGTKRWIGIVMSIYVLVILVGSVHLAWHYAVDGYASIAGMILIWWVVGRALARKDAAQRGAAVSETA
jgi:hypothetical protein